MNEKKVIKDYKPSTEIKKMTLKQIEKELGYEVVIEEEIE